MRDDRGQRIEDRGQRIEDRGQRIEDRGQRTEDRGQRIEDRGQRIEDRGQRTEDRGQRIGFQAQSPKPKAQGPHLTPHTTHLIPHTLYLTPHRRGVTLLEVLISIFVVAVGLLGVAAMIPIGTLAVSETAKADRSSAMARAAMHEVRVREMLERMRTPNYARWYFARSGLALDDTSGGIITRQQFLVGQAFAIDPMFATEAAIQQSPVGYDAFPYAPANPPVLTPLQLLPLMRNEPRLLRLRLDIFEGALMMIHPTPPFEYINENDQDRADLSLLQLAVFERIFMWQDDLQFDIDEDDPDRRPRQSYVWDDMDLSDPANPIPIKSITPYPPRPDDVLPPTVNTAVNVPLYAKSEDKYTWMLTAVPDPNELPNKLTPSAQLVALGDLEQKKYTVSIVTFYGRDFNADPTADPPSERFVGINFNGTGIGGGDATLTIPVALVSSQEQAEEYLKVKDNEWIMVTGFVPDPRLDPIYGATNGKRRIANWYRVIRVDDEVQLVGGAYTRQLTLAGPDWNTANQPSATLIDGAIGVYTTTVTLP